MNGKKPYTFKYAEALRRARIEYGEKIGQKVTQEKLAEAIDTSVESVRDWEQGRRPPNGENLFRLCELYDCDMDYLIGRIECSTHDIQFIHDQTGLSESAIRKLQEQKQLRHNAADVLSGLIDHRLFVELVKNITIMTNGNFNQAFAQAVAAHLIAETPYVDSPEDFRAAYEFQCSKILTTIIDDMKE